MSVNKDFRIVIIGYGNPLRADDAIGVLIIEELSQLLPPGDSIKLVARHQLDVVDAEIISDCQAVIFVDAHVDRRLEDIHIKTIVPPYEGIASTTHISSPEEMLKLTQSIYATAPPAYICAVRGYDFSLGGPVTGRALILVHRAALEIMGLVHTLQQ